MAQVEDREKSKRIKDKECVILPVDYSLKTKRKEFRAKGIFYTPPELGLFLKSFLPEDLTEIYDPTCGHGALLELFPDSVKKYGQEINEEAIEPARSIPNSEIVHGDTLVNPAFMDKKFRGIIANPPFSMRWTPPKSDPRFDVAPAIPPASKADYAFVLHILHYLAEDGTAATIVPGGILYRPHAEFKIRKWMVEQNYIDQIISIPPDTFQDTSIPVVVMVLKKNRERTDITFSDKATGQSVDVSFSAIVKKEFHLAPAAYLPSPEVKIESAEDVRQNTINGELEIRAQVIEYIRRSIEMSRMLRSLFPEIPPLDPWLDEIQTIIDESRSIPTPKPQAIDAHTALAMYKSVRRRRMAPLSKNQSVFTF